ncbi:MAG: tetratricopeptide repeat protein [Patescibacteria group bacterium]|nr:tetratricopeptide repeat protein [Patescibacteria group bacterium]
MINYNAIISIIFPNYQTASISALILLILAIIIIIAIIKRRSCRRQEILRDKEKALSEARLHSIENATNSATTDAIIEHAESSQNQQSTKKRVRNAEINRILRRVEILMARDNFDEAERLLIEIVADDENNKKAYGFLAEIHLRRQLPAKAKLLAEKALELDQNNAMAHHVLGQIYFAEGNMDLALQAYKQLAEIDPKRATNHFILARLLNETGDHDAAKISLEKALSLSPRNREIILAMADHLHSYAPSLEYIQFLQKVAAFMPYDEEIRQRLDAVGGT